MFRALSPAWVLTMSLACLACATTASTSPAPPSMPNGDFEHRAFQRFVERYFHGYFDFRPGEATDEGLHDRDAKMPDLSRASIGREVERLRASLAELSSMKPEALSPDDRIDRELLLSAIHAELFELTEVRSWAHQPSYYGDRISWGVFSLVKRSFAPLDERMKDVIARERAIPGLLAAAEKNLERPPRLWVEVALDDVAGTIDFLSNDVLTAFASVDEPALKADLEASTKVATDTLRSYLGWLKSDLLPRADGDFRLGEERYRKKLLYEEMVDLPLDRLLDIGEAELRRQQAKLAATARQIDPTLPPIEVLAKLTRDHPTAQRLLPDTQELLTSLRSFVIDHHVVGVPSEVMPKVAETPPFARAFTFASMDTPGPLEPKAREAFFYITLPEPSWSAQRTEEHLEAFWRGDIANTAIHEAFPGHYVQFLWLPKSPTLVRKLIGANTFIEGWAHYTEEMLLEEGYGQGDPKLWISEEQWALVRLCRYLVGIRMHTRGMSLDDGVRFFEKEAYMTHANALREAQRGTADPIYLYYALGKLEIEKLRSDYKAKLGPAFSLEGFHDALLSIGAPPIPVAREILLGEKGDIL
ncbi:MAG: DUF885 domain-containing protein [Deltaproteobacteria bacterium]